jgi:TorA maturation chaperone TorD
VSAAALPRIDRATRAQARADLFRALATIVEPPDGREAAIAAALGLAAPPSAAEHAELFLFAAYPYASVHLGAEGMLGGEARDRIAGFWRALGLTPPPEPDHLASLLGMYAALLDAAAEAGAEAGLNGTHAENTARSSIVRRSRAAFLWEHLLAWTPVWLAKVQEIGGATHRSWARLLGEALLDEALEVEAPPSLPLALRSAPGLPADDARAADWISALLAPVRCGVLLTRADLARAARELGIGSRIGERAFMLRALFEQDADATSGWLADEAARVARSHQELEATLGPVAAFWRGRAETTAAALLRVRPDHGKVVSHGDRTR